jgi:hypothetical protein
VKSLSDRLWVLIEGEQDERFFKKILHKQFRKKYKYVHYWPYAEEKPELFEGMISSCIDENIDYIITGDCDSDDPNTHVDKLYERSNKIVNKSNIFIIIKEIESWYLSGLSEDKIKLMEFKESFDNTNDLTKQDFENMKPKKYKSFYYYITTILSYFDHNIAINKNNSFKQFIEKYELYNETLV